MTILFRSGPLDPSAGTSGAAIMPSSDHLYVLLRHSRKKPSLISDVRLGGNPVLTVQLIFPRI